MEFFLLPMNLVRVRIEIRKECALNNLERYSLLMVHNTIKYKFVNLNIVLKKYSDHSYRAFTSSSVV